MWQISDTKNKRTKFAKNVDMSFESGFDRDLLWKFISLFWLKLDFLRTVFLKSDFMVIDQVTNSQSIEIETIIIDLFVFCSDKLFSVNAITCFSLKIYQIVTTWVEAFCSPPFRMV